MPGTIGRSSGEAADPRRLAVELLNEQVRHNLAVALVIGRATEWDGVLQVQEDFIHTSFERMQRLAACCFDLFQSRMVAGMVGR